MWPQYLILVLMESSNLLARVKNLHETWPWVIFPGICTRRRFLRIISTFSRNHSWPHGVVVTEKAHRYLILWYGYTWAHLTFSSSPRINNYHIENFAALHSPTFSTQRETKTLKVSIYPRPRVRRHVRDFITSHTIHSSVSHLIFFHNLESKQVLYFFYTT